MPHFYKFFLTAALCFGSGSAIAQFGPATSHSGGALSVGDPPQGCRDVEVRNDLGFDEDAAPALGFPLDAAYPNPTTGTLAVPFLLSDEAYVRIALFDVLGRDVAVLADDFRNAGPHAVGFDGSTLPTRAYFYRLEVEGGRSAADSVPDHRPMSVT